MVTGTGRDYALGYNLVLRYLENGDTVVATARKESVALNQLKEKYNPAPLSSYEAAEILRFMFETKREDKTGPRFITNLGEEYPFKESRKCMKEIDYQNWNRKEIYEFFAHVSNPFYMVSFRLDVTELYEYVHQKKLSFYLSLIHFCTQAINAVENFRYCVQDDKVMLLENRRPSFTDLKKGSELFQIVTVDTKESLEEFVCYADEKRKKQECFIDFSEEADNLIYFSSLPQVRLTALTNERNLEDPQLRKSNIPSIGWGKIEEVNGRKELAVSLEVNHRFIDGIHVSAFVKKLEELLNNLK